MVALVVFAQLSKFGPKDLRLPALVFTWFCLAALIASTSFLFTSVFFNWPLILNITQLSGEPISPRVVPNSKK